MFRFVLTCLVLQSLIVEVLSLYCYVCSNCDQTSDYSLTSEFVGTTDDLSCYKITSKTFDYSEIIIRGYTRAKCTPSQITDVWGYKEGFCCNNDYCNTTVQINLSMTLFLVMFIILFYKN